MLGWYSLVMKNTISSYKTTYDLLLDLISQQDRQHGLGKDARQIEQHPFNKLFIINKRSYDHEYDKPDIMRQRIAEFLQSNTILQSEPNIYAGLDFGQVIFANKTEAPQLINTEDFLYLATSNGRNTNLYSSGIILDTFKINNLSSLKGLIGNIKYAQENLAITPDTMNYNFTLRKNRTFGAIDYPLPSILSKFPITQDGINEARARITPRLLNHSFHEDFGLDSKEMVYITKVLSAAINKFEASKPNSKFTGNIEMEINLFRRPSAFIKKVETAMNAYSMEPKLGY